MKILTNEASAVRKITASEMKNLTLMVEVFPELTTENITVKAVGMPKSTNSK